MTFKNIDELITKLDYIDVYISATHLNYVNDNALLYTTNAVKNGGESWLKPYPKPQLLHHDKSKDAIGRIIDYTIENNSILENEPADWVQLKSRISDKDAMIKVLNGIYYTCSVGSTSHNVRCSICNQNLTEDGLCEHEKGSRYKGKLVHWIIDEIEYRENSFVNDPADSYSRIISIDIGDGPMVYDDFLTNKEKILTDFFMEDNMKKRKLSSDERAKLADSIFCGPGRTFPTHDANHVHAGLKLLKDVKFEDSTKQKIASALYRKGSRFDIKPTDSELADNSELLIYRMEDDFTEAEIKTITEYFDSNPDADLPIESDDSDESDNSDSSDIAYTIDSYDSVIKGKKDEIIKFCDYLVSSIKDLTDKVDTLTTLNNDLTDKKVEQNTILNSKEDEINKLLDSNAKLMVDYKKALVRNILDFKNVTKVIDEEFKKYDSRKIDSLIDTLTDFRSNIDNDIPKVNDVTLMDSNESDNNTSGKKLNNDDSHEESKIDRFFKHNIITED